jgi:hypothetical protein
VLVSAVDIPDDDADFVLVAKDMEILDVGDRRRFERPFLQGAGLVAVYVARVYAEAVIFFGLGHNDLLPVNARHAKRIHLSRSF